MIEEYQKSFSINNINFEIERNNFGLIKYQHKYLKKLKKNIMINKNKYFYLIKKKN